ncbi:MAG: UDP-2,3-diacylglucosamine diphosphatase [Alistipes ihumii]
MYYFASDTHLGLRVGRTADDRERLFVRWLDEVSADAEGIFLVGDIFDFWYEYKRVVPRGFTRLLGKLSGLTDRGIPSIFSPAITICGHTTTSTPNAASRCTGGLSNCSTCTDRKCS